MLGDNGRWAESSATGDAVIAANRRLIVLAGGAAGARRGLASVLRTTGGNHYNGGDYAGACRFWAETLAIYAALEKEGALSDRDRKNAVNELSDYSRRSCDPPRQGLGPEV